MHNAREQKAKQDCLKAEEQTRKELLTDRPPPPPPPLHAPLPPPLPPPPPSLAPSAPVGRTSNSSACTHSPGLVEHLHMRKAGGTTLRMNVAAGCRPRGVQVVEQEWGAFKWNAAATRAKRGAEETLALITSVVPPMERLVSAYFFEGPRHGGPHTHGSPCHASQHDPGINLEGAVPSPSWTAQNWAFVRSCFGSYLQLHHLASLSPPFKTRHLSGRTS